jgi:hypothetical protein
MCVQKCGNVAAKKKRYKNVEGKKSGNELHIGDRKKSIFTRKKSLNHLTGRSSKCTWRA